MGINNFPQDVEKREGRYPMRIPTELLVSLKDVSLQVTLPRKLKSVTIMMS